MRIVGLNQPNLLFTSPCFDFFFSCDRRPYVAEKFIMNQSEDPILRCKAGNKALAVFDHAAGKIVRHSDVEVQ